MWEVDGFTGPRAHPAVPCGGQGRCARLHIGARVPLRPRVHVLRGGEEAETRCRRWGDAQVHLQQAERACIQGDVEGGGDATGRRGGRDCRLPARTGGTVPESRRVGPGIRLHAGCRGVLARRPGGVAGTARDACQPRPSRLSSVSYVKLLFSPRPPLVCCETRD